MRKRMIILIICLVVVFGGIFGWKAFVNYQIDKALANRKVPPVAVSTSKAERASWTPRLDATGSLRAIQGVDVTTEVSGKVEKIAFESGQQVAKDDVLIRLDASTDQAELRGLVASGELARQTLKRKRDLRKRGVGSQAELDQAQSEYDNAKAAAAAKRAVIDKKSIRAPFSGTIGIREVDLGEYLAPGTAIATLQALKTMYLDFDLPQGAFPKVKAGQEVSLSLDAYPEQAFTGKVSAINPLVNDATRSFQVRATFDNAKGDLRPGMFGKISLDLAGSDQVLTVPAPAITYNTYGDFVYVVQTQRQAEKEKKEREQKQNADVPAQDQGHQAEAIETANKTGENADADDEHSADDTLVATRRNVRTGETRGDQVQILDGLKPGTQVVIFGSHKLKPGAVVKVDNSHIPDIEGHPSEVDNY